MMKRFDKKENLGITLIALVITIVILIILAGVAISLALGNNGLFNKAKEAKEKYINAQDYEETEVGKMTNNIDVLMNSFRESESVCKKDDKFVLKVGNNHYDLGFKPSIVFFDTDGIWTWIRQGDSTFYAASVGRSFSKS